jgi:hypothetical protein
MSDQADGIPCPDCRKTGSTVIAIRHRAGFTYRRRKCRACGGRFSTTEKLAGTPDMSTYVHLMNPSIHQLIETMELCGFMDQFRKPPRKE